VGTAEAAASRSRSRSSGILGNAEGERGDDIVLGHNAQLVIVYALTLRLRKDQGHRHRNQEQEERPTAMMGQLVGPPGSRITESRASAVSSAILRLVEEARIRDLPLHLFCDRVGLNDVFHQTVSDHVGPVEIEHRDSFDPGQDPFDLKESGVLRISGGQSGSCHR
jgi:hypothetical protein